MIVQPFCIEPEQLKNIESIAPAGKDYNLHLSKGQHWELSPSKKVLFLVNESPFKIVRFIVSKTVFLLKEGEE